MDGTNKNEQWKPGMGGHCLQCKRQDYCKRACTERNKRVDKEIKQKIEEFMWRNNRI